MTDKGPSPFPAMHDRRVATCTPVRTCIQIVRESKKKYDPIKKKSNKLAD